MLYLFFNFYGFYAELLHYNYSTTLHNIWELLLNPKPAWLDQAKSEMLGALGAMPTESRQSLIKLSETNMEFDSHLPLQSLQWSQLSIGNNFFFSAVCLVRPSTLMKYVTKKSFFLTLQFVSCYIFDLL